MTGEDEGLSGLVARQAWRAIEEADAVLLLVDGRAGYRLIDPKGLHGDPLFDLGYLVSRTMPLGVDALPIDRAVSLRLDVLAAAFGCERQRLAAWAFVAAALSAVWTLEDHGEVYADEIAVLRQLAGCLRARTKSD